MSEAVAPDLPGGARMRLGHVVHEDFARLFAAADRPANVELHELLIAPVLSPEARSWREARDLRGRRRIEMLARRLYRHGWFGRFIGLGHTIAKVYGVGLGELADAASPAAQKARF